MESAVELKYRELIDAMTAKERMARAAALLQWSREAIARRIVAESGPMDSERLKWHVALRQYGADPATRKMIQRILDDVPR